MTILRTALGVAVLLLVGCNSNPVSRKDSDRAPSSSSVESVLPENQPAVGLDAKFNSIASSFPKFAGYYLEGSTLILGVVGVPLSAELLKDRVLGELGTFRASSISGVEIRPVEYTFHQLLYWRRLLDQTLESPGIISSDVDEARNRVRISVEGNELQLVVSEVSERLGIPVEAVLVELDQRPSFRSTQIQTLTSTVRPIVGGLEIEQGGYGCTLGIIADRSSRRVMITNSHCTSVYGGSWGDLFYQQDYPDFIGTEFVDPLFKGNIAPACKPGRFCRFSDTAAIMLEDTLSSDRGRIAKTNFPGSSSLVITGQFDIVGEVSEPITGEVLNKMGSSTGWTQGTVSATCEHFDLAGSNKLLCQDTVTGGGVASGDSGSPVFRIIGGSDEVYLYGIAWGGSPTEIIFSAMFNVEVDMGPLLTVIP